MWLCSSLLAATIRPGDLDLEFANRIRSSLHESSYAHTLLAEPDGTILAVGSFSTLSDPSSIFNIIQIAPNGGIQRFGPPKNPGELSRVLQCAAILSNKAIAVGGSISQQTGQHSGYFSLLNSDLSSGTFFNTTFDSSICSMVADGNTLLVGGYFTNVNSVSRRGIVRLKASGGLDYAFQPGEGIGGSNSPAVMSIALQLDRRILLAGSFTEFNGTPCQGVIRLHSNGKVDPSFRATQIHGTPSSVVVQPDGRILLAGSLGCEINKLQRRGVIRLHSDGSIDHSFHVELDQVTALKLLADGKILVGSGSNILRLYPDGSLDGNFTIIGSNTGIREVNAIDQSNDKVVVAGRYTHGGGLFYTHSVFQLHTGPIDATAPVIIQQPHASLFVDAGSDTAISTVARGFALQFQWQFRGKDIPGATNSQLILANLNPQQAGEYQLRVFNPLGEVVGQAVQLVVEQKPPLITQQPQSQNVLAGQEARFSVTSTAAPLPSFQWQFNGSNLAGETNSLLVLPATTLANQGKYKVVVTNPAGSIVSDTATLSIKLAAPGITEQPKDQLIHEGNTLELAIKTTGAPAPHIQWTVDGKEIPGATNSILVIAGISASQSGKYRALVSNPVGSLFSQEAQVTVIPFLSLGKSVNAEQLVWTTGGATAWISQTNTIHLDSAAAQSGPISHNQESWIQTDIQGPGSLSFWWKVSSESGFDALHLQLNGTTIKSISGETSWQEIHIQLPSRNNTVRWTYRKDGGGSEGQDRAWLDNIQITTSQSDIVLVRPQFRSSGEFSIEIQAPKGRTFELQSSADLVTWQTEINSLATGLTQAIRISPKPGRSAMFYRAVSTD